MQYKIPIQIENEDPIVLWLSLRQLTIIMAWWWIWYSVFKNLTSSISSEIAFIPSITIFIIGVSIAVFKFSEMTFVPFILSFIRFKLNLEERIWQKWVDSYQPIEIWYLTNIENKSNNKIDFTSKINKLKNIDNEINKI